MASVLEGLAQNRSGSMEANPDILGGRSGHLGDILVAAIIELPQENYSFERRLKASDEFRDAIPHLSANDWAIRLVPRTIIHNILEGLRSIEIVTITRECLSFEIHTFLSTPTKLVNREIPGDSIKPVRERGFAPKPIESRQSSREGLLHQIVLSCRAGQADHIALQRRA
jgi:hypothetical protein